MRTAAASPPRGGSSRRRIRDRPAFALGVRAISWALLACGAALLAAVPVGLGNAGAAVAWVSLGAGCALAGVLGRRAVPMPSHPPAVAVFAAACATWAAMIATSTVAYLLAGATGSIGDALFESVAGFCTTGLSVLGGLESLPAGVLLWRALTQWIGGFAALVFLVAALPLHAAALALPGEDGALPNGASVPLFAIRLRRLATVYGSLTVLCTAGYAAAGMGPPDAFGYAFTTVSTGGFANHATGLGHFDSPAVEWVATGAMAIVGVSAMALWWVLRGRVGALARSFEFRVYLLVMAVGVAATAAWTWGDAGVSALRRSAFAVAAAMSSTGFEPAGWAGWATGAQILLVALIATGGMSGTPGGGFQMRRAIAAARYAYRELVVEIHPQTVHVVKIGRRPVPERPLALLNGYQILFALAVGAGLFTLSLSGMDLWTAAGASISALATMGPVPGADGVGAAGADRAALAVLMLLGRLGIFPLVVAAVGLPTAVRRRLAYQGRGAGR